MSYSRWIGSCWYTYWLSTESKERNEQMFDICGFTTISYQQILDLGIDGVIDMLKAKLAEINSRPDEDRPMFTPEGYTDDEWDELKIYIKRWVADVKEEFDTPSQLYRDGELTLEEAFVEEI